MYYLNWKMDILYYLKDKIQEKVLSNFKVSVHNLITSQSNELTSINIKNHKIFIKNCKIVYSHIDYIDIKLTFIV